MSTVRWIGAAQDVRQVSTITVTGTWATGDTATLTINAKSLTVTIGAATSTSNVAAALAAAVDAANAADGLLGTESRNFGGQEIPEFAELDASANGAVLTLESATPGVPWTLTRSEVTAGDGALGAVTAVTAATGKNWLSNAANYSTGAVPVDDDVLVFDSGDVDVLYGLDQFRTSDAEIVVLITGDWTGQLGLPSVNATGGYPEYRSRYFQYRGTGDKLEVLPGVTTPASSARRLWIDLQDQTGNKILIDAHRGAATVPNVFLAGAHATTQTNTLTVRRGHVVVEPEDAPTGSTKYAVFSDIDIGTPSGALADTTVVFQRNAGLTAATTFELHSGVCRSYAQSAVTNSLRGGSMYLHRLSSAEGSFDVYAGATLYPIGDGTYGTVKLYGGAFDARQSNKGNTITAIKAYSTGSAIYDPSGLWVTEYHAIGIKPSQVTTDLPANKKVTLGTATP